MVVGICTIELRIPENSSLKGKRHVLKSVLTRLHNEFNVSAAEVDSQDTWQRAVLGLAAVSSDAAYVHGLLERCVQSVSAWRIDADVVDYEIEILNA